MTITQLKKPVNCFSKANLISRVTPTRRHPSSEGSNEQVGCSVDPDRAVYLPKALDHRVDRDNQDVRRGFNIVDINFTFLGVEDRR